MLKVSFVLMDGTLKAYIAEEDTQPLDGMCVAVFSDLNVHKIEAALPNLRAQTAKYLHQAAEQAVASRSLLVLP